MKLIARGRNWIVAGALIASSCVYREIPIVPICTNSDLAVILVSKISATTCKSIDGRITVTATGGIGPYDYKIGDGIYQTNPVFAGIGPGLYSITAKDTKGCKSKIDVDVQAANSTLTATFTSSEDNQCQPPHNGTIQVNPSGGVMPYLIKIDAGTFGTVTAFNNLQSGSHTVIVKDFEDCERTLQIVVVHGKTGVSYAGQIAPILNLACNFSGCHGAGTSGRDWTLFSDVQAKASSIKIRTGNHTMPIGTGPTLTAEQIQLIACWVDDGAENN